nr:hypothetical protein [Kibdelosporangium sp. MJ126-NF4]
MTQHGMDFSAVRRTFHRPARVHRSDTVSQTARLASSFGSFASRRSRVQLTMSEPVDTRWVSAIFGALARLRSP